MKLLVIASLSETATANYFIAAFLKSGHDLLVCSDIPGANVDKVISGLFDVPNLLRTHGFDADAMVFFEGGSMRLLPDTTNCQGLVTSWYAIDTHMDFTKHVRIGRLFDYTFVAQQEYVDHLTTNGVTSVQWLPLAFAPDILPADEPSRDIDIAYVGSENAQMHPERSAMLSMLAEAFPAHKFGRASPNEMGEIYSRSKIVFNRAVNNDINMRVFEAMGSGAVLLTDKLIDNGMECLFDEGTHYITYRDRDDLIPVVKSLLAEPARLQAIGGAARDRIGELHTYQHRADRLVSVLKGATKSTSPQAPDLFAACLSLGFASDALRTAARSVQGISGGRFQRALGAMTAKLIRVSAFLVTVAERLKSTVVKARHE